MCIFVCIKILDGDSCTIKTEHTLSKVIINDSRNCLINKKKARKHGLFLRLVRMGGFEHPIDTDNAMVCGLSCAKSCASVGLNYNLACATFKVPCSPAWPRCLRGRYPLYTVWRVFCFLVLYGKHAANHNEPPHNMKAYPNRWAFSFAPFYHARAR